MAFIVPVVRKDYNLYGNTRKHTGGLSKSGRSNSTPVSVRIVSHSVESLEKNLARQAAISRRQRQYSTCTTASSTPNSPASVGHRRSSRRISIRHLNSAESTDSNVTTDSKKRVHFGHCEEIEYDSHSDCEEQDNNSIDTRPNKLTQRRRPVQIKRTSVSSEKPIDRPNSARPRSVSLIDIEPKKCELQSKQQHSALSTILRLAKLISPGN